MTCITSLLGWALSLAVAGTCVCRAGLYLGWFIINLDLYNGGHWFLRASWAGGLGSHIVYRVSIGWIIRLESFILQPEQQSAVNRTKPVKRQQPATQATHGARYLSQQHHRTVLFTTGSISFSKYATLLAGLYAQYLCGMLHLGNVHALLKADINLIKQLIIGELVCCTRPHGPHRFQQTNCPTCLTYLDLDA